MGRADARQLLKESRRLAAKAPLDEARAGELAELQRALQGAIETRGDLAKAATELDAFLDAHLGAHRKGRFREHVESIGVAIIAALFLRAFVVEAFQIPTGSMEPTLLVGDHLFVSKFAYGIRVPFTTKYLIQWGDIDRGDIVVFEFPVHEVATQYTIGEVMRHLDAYRDANGGYPATIEDARLDSGALVDGWGAALRYSLVGADARLVSSGADGEFDTDDDLDNTNAALQGGETECLASDSLISAKDYIKRTIGLPGDRVSMDNGTLYINGAPVERDPRVRTDVRVHGRPVVAATEHLGDDISYETWSIGLAPDFDEIVVRPGHIFVMGDNRDNSSDGRCWGQVPVENVKGRALFIFFSRDRRPEALGGASNWFSSIRWSRTFDTIH